MEYNVCCEHPLWIKNPKIFDAFMTMDKFCYCGSWFNIDPVRRSSIFHGRSIWRIFNIRYIEKPSLEQRMSSFVMNDDGVIVDFFIQVPCGKCAACRNKYVGGLRQRIAFACEESDTDVLFATLTYNDNHLPLDGLPSVRHVQLFKKRLNQVVMKEFGVKLKYAIFAEIGSKGRPHYHMLVFGFPNIRYYDNFELMHKLRYFRYCWRDVERVGKHYISFGQFCRKHPKSYSIKVTDFDYDSRSYGFINLSTVNSKQAANYVTKYVSKCVDDSKLFKLISVNLGLDFAMRNLPFAESAPDRSFSYVSRLDGSFNTCSLCSYYLKKLMPSSSVLFPRVVRDAIFNIRYYCDYITRPFNKGLFKKSFVRDALRVRHEVDSLFPDFESREFSNFFIDNDYDYEKKELISQVRCESLINSFLAVINSYSALKIDLSFDRKRSAYMSGMALTTEQYACLKAQKFRKECSALKSKAIL